MKVEWIREGGFVPAYGQCAIGDIIDLPEETAKLWESRGWVKPVATEFILKVDAKGELK